MLGTRERELDVLQSLPLAGAVVELSEGGGLEEGSPVRVEGVGELTRG